MSATENTACEVTGSVSIKNEPLAGTDIIPKKIVGIYGLRNKTTGKWYVGQSRNIYHRWNRYYKNSNCEQQVKLYNAICKYGYEDFDKLVLEECIPDKTLLDTREKYWISYYNSFEDGYNLTLGGGAGFMTDEIKKKIGDANRGRKLGPMSKEHIENRRKSQTGQKRSDEFRERLREVNLGKKHSDETKKKMSEYKKSEEHINKIANALKGRTLSEEHRAAVKAGLERRKLLGLPLGGNRTPPSAEARRKMSEASKNYWANIKSKNANML